MKAVVCITEKPGNVSLISNILQIGQNNVHQCLVVWTWTSKDTLLSRWMKVTFIGPIYSFYVIQSPSSKESKYKILLLFYLVLLIGCLKDLLFQSIGSRYPKIFQGNISCHLKVSRNTLSFICCCLLHQKQTLEAASTYVLSGHLGRFSVLLK